LNLQIVQFLIQIFNTNLKFFNIHLILLYFLNVYIVIARGFIILKYRELFNCLVHEIKHFFQLFLNIGRLIFLKGAFSYQPLTPFWYLLQLLSHNTIFTFKHFQLRMHFDIIDNNIGYFFVILGHEQFRIFYLFF